MHEKSTDELWRLFRDGNVSDWYFARKELEKRGEVEPDVAQYVNEAGRN